MTGGDHIASMKRSLGQRAAWLDSAVYWLLLVGGCAVFLLMNFYTTLKEDDYFHSFIQTAQGSGDPIRSLVDVVRAWLAYMCFDARTANLVDFLFNGILGKTAFNVCNTLVFGLMAHLVSRLSTGRNSAMALVVLYTFIVAACPTPGETLLWVAGSCNYLWSFTASLLVVAYLLWHRNPRPAWWQAVAVVLLSFLAGGSNEGTTFGVFGGMVMYYLFNRDRVDRAVVLAMLGYMAGVVLLLSCPGAWHRASLEVTHDAGIMSLLAERMRVVTTLSLKYVTPLAVLVIAVAAVIKRGFKSVFTSTPWPWIFIVMLAFAFVIGRAVERLFFPVAMVGLMIVLMALHDVTRRMPWARVAVIVVGLAVCAKWYPSNIMTMKAYKAYDDQAVAEMSQPGVRQVIAPARTFGGYSRFIKPFNYDSWNYFIRCQTLCRRFGKDNIQFVPDSVCTRYHQGRLLDGAQPMPFTSSMPSHLEQVLAVPGQAFMAVKMHQDTVSFTYQFAHTFDLRGERLVSLPYFPILYQGNEYLLFVLPDDAVARLKFCPFDLEGDTVELVRTAPNPQWATVPAGQP